jgi:ribosomal protein S30
VRNFSQTCRIAAKQDKATTKRNKKELKEQGEEDIGELVCAC